MYKYNYLSLLKIWNFDQFGYKEPFLFPASGKLRNEK